jgi:hypothetical protein
MEGHASNIPLIYNPITTHVSPQFHMVYDEGFTSITSLSVPSKDALLEKIYNKAYWSHDTSMMDDTSYQITSFWENASLPTKPSDRGRKHSHDGSPSFTTPGLPNVTNTIPFRNPNETSHHHFSQAEGDNLSHSTNTVLLSNSTNIPAVLATEENPPNFGPTMGINTLHPGLYQFPSAAVSAHDIPPPHGAMAVSADDINTSDATHTNIHIPSKVHSQYTVYHGTTGLKAYKIQRGITNNIYVAKTSPPFQLPSAHAKNTCTQSGFFPHISSSFLDLPVFTLRQQYKPSLSWIIRKIL